MTGKRIQEALRQIIAGGRDEEDLGILARAILRKTTRGEWRDGPGTTNILDWLSESHYNGTETVDVLAAGWDEGVT